MKNSPPAYTEQTGQSGQSGQNQSIPMPLTGSPHPQPTTQVIYDHQSMQPINYTVRNNVIYVPLAAPCLMYCPVEGKLVQTVIVKQTGARAYACTALFCLFCFPCFWIPLLCTAYKDDVHICSQCGRTLCVIG